MKCQILTLIFYSLISLKTASSQTEYVQNIYFDFDKSIITNDHKKLIQSFVNKLDKHGYSEITIVGHTDQDGSNQYNKELSQKRAHSVKSYLASQELEQRITGIDWKGETELISRENSSSSKKQNRRVALIAHAYDFENSNDILTSIDDKSPTVVNVNSKESQNINCKQGTIVNIPKDAFVNLDGSPMTSSNIEVEVKEAFTYADFISEGLFTHSKGDILETGGMIYVNATSNGQPIKLKEGQTIEVLYPAQEVKKDMELFYATYDENNEIDWAPTSQPFASTTVGTSAYDYEIDWDALLNFDFEGAIERPSLYFPEMASKPSLGHKPFPPSKPIEPTLQNTSVQLNTIDKVLKGKKKKEALKQEKYEEAKKKYDAELADYEESYKNYLTNLENYKNAIPQKEAAIIDWNKEVDRRIGAVNNYKSGMKKFHVYAQIKGVSKKIKKEVGQKSNKELLNLLNRMMQSPINLSLNERRLYRKVFGNQTKRILDERKIYPKDIEFRTEYNKSVFPYIAEIISRSKQQAIEEEFAKTGKIDNGEFGKYLTNISQLGWINCDRFANFPQQMLANVYLKDEGDDVKYYLIFTDMKSMLPAKRTKDKESYVIANMPQDKQVKIVGVKLNDKEPQMSVIDYKIGKDNYLAMEFNPASLSDIRTELNAID